jgi:hypothetical protein
MISNWVDVPVIPVSTDPVDVGLVQLAEVLCVRRAL